MTLIQLASTRHTTLAKARIYELKKEIASRQEEIKELEAMERNVEEVAKK